MFAESVARAAFQANPGPQTAYALARLLLARKALEEASQTIQAGLALAPLDVGLNHVAGELYLRQNQPAKAVATLQEALQYTAAAEKEAPPLSAKQASGTGPPGEVVLKDQLDLTASIRLTLALAYFAAGNPVRAMGQLHLVLKQAPDHAEAHRLRGTIAASSGDERQAAADFAAAIALGLGDAELYEQLAEVLATLEDHTAALEAYDMVIRLAPRQINAYLSAGPIAESQGFLTRARRYYEAASAFPKHRAEASEALARIAKKLADGEGAKPGLSGGEPACSDGEDDFPTPPPWNPQR